LAEDLNRREDTIASCADSETNLASGTREGMDELYCISNCSVERLMDGHLSTVSAHDGGKEAAGML
jgi:hypothetical protein